MSKFSVLASIPAVLALGLPAAAQAARPRPASSTAAVDLSSLKQELKSQIEDELRERLKAELKAEISAEGGAGGAPGVKEDTWAEEEWKWEEPTRPELNFLELHGYFRFRPQLFKNIDLGTYQPPTSAAGGLGSGPFAPGTSPTSPICVTDPTCRSQRANPGGTLAGANMRMRIEPTLNVFEDIKLKMQADVFDNLIMGSTPEGLPQGVFVPISFLSGTQAPPTVGVNSVTDAIRIKRVWAEVMTPLGQLRLGRMPSQFGLGIITNDGSRLDSDYGDNIDRILFETKIAGHSIVPSYEWVSTGASSAILGDPLGQPYDRDQRDDVIQWVLAVLKRDKPQEIKEHLENDEAVVNYGAYLAYRTQAQDSLSYYEATSGPASGATVNTLVARNAKSLTASLWFKYVYRKLHIEAEAAAITGHFGNFSVSPTATAEEPVDIRKFGGALVGDYKLLHDSLTLHLLLAFATGDKDYGWGAKPGLTASANGSWDGLQTRDGKITNFSFHRDFVVDMILWRQLVGTLTDAVVVRPGIQYNITEGFGGRLDLVYSRAWFASSTPSASIVNDPNHGVSRDLGIEADLKLFYVSEDGFHAWLQYGILFPMAGLNRAVAATNGGSTTLESSIAQTLQLMFAVTY